MTDFSCVCPAGSSAGEPPDVNGQCPSSHDPALIEEVKKTDPSLARVRALLAAGARSGVTVSNGTPLIFVAATLGHAKIVSVLITAGADPDVTLPHPNHHLGTVRSVLPLLVGTNGRYPVPDSLPWATAADVIVHFGNAVAILTLTSTLSYDWTARESATIIRNMAYWLTVTDATKRAEAFCRRRPIRKSSRPSPDTCWTRGRLSERLRFRPHLRFLPPELRAVRQPQILLLRTVPKRRQYCDAEP